MKQSMFCALAIALLAGCSREMPKGFLGSAVVEATTYRIACTGQGAVIDVRKQEGETVAAGEILAVIDTSGLSIKVREVSATLAELEQTTAAKEAEIASLGAETRGLAREYGRIGQLVDKGAVPSQKKDDLGTKVESANLRLRAARHVHAALAEKKKALQAKQALLRDQIEKCSLCAPADGVVISRFRNRGEVVAPGMPVFEIASYDTMYVCFFVPQVDLAELKYGDSVRIRLDIHSGDGGGRLVPASIVWISNEAEYSPGNIQTRESRNELVFRVKAAAPNPEGLLKRGLPVEVWRPSAGD